MTALIKTNEKASAIAHPQEKRPPSLMVSIGTTMALVVRYLWKWCEGALRHVYLRSIETTAQRDHPDVQPLSSDMFLDLSEAPGIQQRLRAALKNPRVSDWISPAVTLMDPGNGAGGEPQLARFLFENSFGRVVRFFEPTLRRIVGSRRAETVAEQRNGSVGHGTSYRNPVHVVLLATTAGGTVSLVEPIRLLLEYIFRSIGGEAKYELVLTLPAVTAEDTVATRKRRKLTHARLQELSDSFAGREYVYQPNDEVTIVAQGPLYAGVCVMPEPLGDGLDEHIRFVAEFLQTQSGPLGKAVTDTVLDDTAHRYSLGPLGQPRFLSAVGMATLRAVPFDILPFAKTVLGMQATHPAVSDKSEAAEKFCRQQGLTPSLVFRSLPAVSTPDASRISEQAGDVFLNNLARRMLSQRNTNVRVAKDEFQTTLRRAAEELVALAKKVALEEGPEAVENLAGEVCQRLESLREVSLELAAAKPPVDAPTSSSLAERAKALSAREGALAKREFSSFVANSLSELLDTAGEIEEKARGQVKLVAKARMKYEAAWRKMRRPAKHSVLTAETLRQQIEHKGQECVQAVRSICWERSDVRSFHKELTSVIARYAETFRPLEQIEEAFKLAPESPQDILERTLAASEPALRMDPIWDLDEYASRLLFTDMPSDHPLAKCLRGRGREPKTAHSTRADTKWTFLHIDDGVEVGALQATKEAYDAYVADPDPNFPVFLDKRYEPITRLCFPPRDEWFAYLAIVLHRCLSRGSIRRDPRGWYFKGVRLGADYVEASKAMRKRENRHRGLPSFDELSAESESLLLDGRSISEAIQILENIEGKLRRDLARLLQRNDREAANQRRVRDEELAVTQTLIDQYAKWQEDLDADEEIWGEEGHDE